ncbi:MAG: DoxX family protein [Chthoniobacterales bacterium]|nr:DoxX family protein [Chthoniobacterales bacterium]
MITASASACACRADSLPQAILVACTECFGSLLLLVGLASRLISVPLMILLTVAYITTESEAPRSIFIIAQESEPNVPFLDRREPAEAMRRNFCLLFLKFFCQANAHS